MTREEAKRRVECCRDFLANNYSDMGEPNFTALNMAIEALSEPTRPKAKWIRQSDDNHDYYECEKCGIAVGIDDIKNFCPNCGAEMESE